MNEKANRKADCHCILRVPKLKSTAYSQKLILTLQRMSEPILQVKILPQYF